MSKRGKRRRKKNRAGMGALMHHLAQVEQQLKEADDMAKPVLVVSNDAKKDKEEIKVTVKDIRRALDYPYKQDMATRGHDILHAINQTKNGKLVLKPVGALYNFYADPEKKKGVVLPEPNTHQAHLVSGSNSSLSQLLRKFGKMIGQDQLFIAKTTSNLVIRKYCPRLSFYGAMPTTFVPQTEEKDADRKHTDCYVLFIPWHLMPCMDRSEGTAGSVYGRFLLKDSLRGDRDYYDFPLYCYIDLLGVNTKMFPGLHTQESVHSLIRDKAVDIFGCDVKYKTFWDNITNIQWIKGLLKNPDRIPKINAYLAKEYRQPLTPNELVRLERVS